MAKKKSLVMPDSVWDAKVSLFIWGALVSALTCSALLNKVLHDGFSAWLWVLIVPFGVLPGFLMERASNRVGIRADEHATFRVDMMKNYNVELIVKASRRNAAKLIEDAESQD